MSAPRWDSLSNSADGHVDCVRYGVLLISAQFDGTIAKAVDESGFVSGMQ